MNLFFTNIDPIKAAQDQCDQYVVKIAIETALFLSAIHWRHGYKGPIGTAEKISFRENKPGEFEVLPSQGPYRDSRIVRPASEIYTWLCSSIQNYRWAVSYGLELTREFTKRYNKIHSTQGCLLWLQQHEPPLPHRGLTTNIGLAMPEEFKNRRDPVKSYRDYIVCTKSAFARWKLNNAPTWYRRKLKNLDKICDRYAIKREVIHVRKELETKRKTSNQIHSPRKDHAKTT